MVLIKLHTWTFDKFGERRARAKEELEAGQRFSIVTRKHIEEAAAQGRTYRVCFNGEEASVEVLGSQRVAVSIRSGAEYPCSCRLYNAIRLPCSHLLAALGQHKPPLDFAPWVDPAWTLSTQLRLYSIPFPAVDTMGLREDQTIGLSAFQPSGSRRTKRLLSQGEVSSLNQKQRCRRTIAGDVVGNVAAQEQRAAELLATPHAVVPVSESRVLVTGHASHVVDPRAGTCDCAAHRSGGMCAHVIAAAQAPVFSGELSSGIVPTAYLFGHH